MAGLDGVAIQFSRLHLGVAGLSWTKGEALEEERLRWAVDSRPAEAST